MALEIAYLQSFKGATISIEGGCVLIEQTVLGVKNVISIPFKYVAPIAEKMEEAVKKGTAPL